MLNLRQLASELAEDGWHCNHDETDADNRAIHAINQRDLELADRKKALVDWLNSYTALMGFSADTRTAIAGEIIAFADERQEESLHLDKSRIVSEFNKLEERISTVVPLNQTGKRRRVTSLTSKALWCCYPDDIPIFDKNAVGALGIISRICHWTPGPDQSEYGRFLDVWFRAYAEVEPVSGHADLSGCPYKVRALDRWLGYLGDKGFYGESAGSPAD